MPSASSTVGDADKDESLAVANHDESISLENKITLSTRKDNLEGLLELEIKNRNRSQAGVYSKFKKRHLK